MEEGGRKERINAKELKRDKRKEEARKEKG